MMEYLHASTEEDAPRGRGMESMRDTVDWPALALQVVTDLRGEPTSQSKRECRWGSRGSLKLNLESGHLYDFELNQSFGLLDFVAQEVRLPDTKAAWKWLQDGHRLPPSHKPSEPRARPSPPEDDRPPFWQADLPRLDASTIPDNPAHPLNRWADGKCGRPPDSTWPDTARWLRRWWGGDALMVPLARPAAWWTDKGLPQTAVQGIQAVHVARDGRPRWVDADHRTVPPKTDGARNKTTWTGKRDAVGCGYMAGPAQAGTRLALCEGVADALALHWHLGLTALAACGSLSKLVDTAAELANLTRAPWGVTRLTIWPDLDAVNARTGQRAGAAGADALARALVEAGASPDLIRISRYGRPGQDPCDWLTET